MSLYNRGTKLGLIQHISKWENKNFMLENSTIEPSFLGNPKQDAFYMDLQFCSIRRTNNEEKDTDTRTCKCIIFFTYAILLRLGGNFLV